MAAQLNDQDGIEKAMDIVAAKLDLSPTEVGELLATLRANYLRTVRSVRSTIQSQQDWDNVKLPAAVKAALRIACAEGLLLTWCCTVCL